MGDTSDAVPSAGWDRSAEAGHASAFLPAIRQTPRTADLPGYLGDKAQLRSAAAAGLLLIAAVAVWAISLSRSLFDPIWIDQAMFRYIAERAIAGQRMYADIHSHNGPAIVGIHWLSIVLFGHSELGLRLFDACWQLATLAALFSLALRDGRQWCTGLLAVILYLLAYYGFGFIDTAEREGFAVLPLLVAAHAVGWSPTRGHREFAGHFLAGFMGFVVFAIKSPLGLCFGVLWLRSLGQGWQRRREGWSALAGTAGLSAGFLAAAAVGVLVLMRLGWWASYWPILTGQELPAGRVLGPWQIRELMPKVLAAGVLVGLMLGLAVLLTGTHAAKNTQPNRLPMALLTALATALVVFALLASLVFWERWRSLSLRIMGLVIPALGAALMRSWHQRSRISQTMLLLGGAALGAVVVQGNFNTYQIHPVMVCAAYLVAQETIEAFRRLRIDPQSARVWMAVCLAGIAHLTVCHWWRKMTTCTTAPYVLAGTSLQDHYAAITRDKTTFPADPTIRRVAGRVQALTAPDDPIALLFLDTRLYLFAQRPPAHKLVYVHDDSRRLFDEFVQSLGQRPPKVLLARVPATLRGSKDLSAVKSAVFDAVEADFGPNGRGLREIYRIGEIIDDVCVLQRNNT